MATRHKVKLNQNAKAFIGIVIALIILAVFLVGLKPAEKTEINPPSPPSTQPIACTADAKLCPDGSAVGRNGSRNCEFNDCPAVTPPAATPNETHAAAFTFPSGFAPPSLKIISFINTPTFPKVGEVDLIRIYVKNVGSDSEATTATLTINGQTAATLDVPALERNAQVVLSYDYTATATGDYTFEVNVAPVSGEEVFDDNYDKITVTVM